MRRLLVTSALPYVNGNIHIGHLVEHVQTNIWVRYQRLRGHAVRYICGADTHGTATMIAARKAGKPESAIIAEQVAKHTADFRDFQIDFDHYGSTDSTDNRALVGEFWAALRRGGHVEEREVTQLFDPQVGTFLADRFVKGTCPRCGAVDQYGDSCDKCGATYSPADLKDARSTLSGATPELRSAPHYFVRLEDFRIFLETWISQGTLEPAIVNWLKGAFLIDGERLRDWDVSRPAPYFGFEIPDAPGHFFYVWLDAPVGYIAATKEWCDAHNEDWRSWWQGDKAEVHHFIGKDIVYFHTLFWPAMLKATGYNLPTRVNIHGMLTVDGEKMSKSKGTFIAARTYLDHLDPAAFRYYIATKLTAAPDDIDLNLTDFTDTVNSHLVGKVVNLASRTARFVPKLADTYPDDGGLFARAAAAADEIAAAYESTDFAKATRLIMGLADRANEFVEAAAPWALKKDPTKAEALQAACTVSLNLFRQLAIYLAPILPDLTIKAGALFGETLNSWDAVATPITGTALAPFEHLMQRIDPVKVQAMIDASRSNEPATAAPAPAVTAQVAAASDAEPLSPTIGFEDFAKIDLRAGMITAAEEVKGAKKILKLSVDLGSLGSRTIFAGIKTAYQAETLVGRLIVVVANLSPKTMSFGTSEGMAIAAGPGGTDIFLLSPDSGAQPGMRIH